MFDAVFRCPKTGNEVYTSVALNEFSSDPQTFTVVCAQCGDEHTLRTMRQFHTMYEAEVFATKRAREA